MSTFNREFRRLFGATPSEVRAAARNLLPSLPGHDRAHYWFLAVSILGATMSPFMFNFYSSGAVEDDWSEEDLGANRATAWTDPD